MIFSGLVIHILWWFSIALEIAIVFGIVRRKLLFTLPFFFSYILSMLSRDIVLVFIKYPGNLYARIYWYGEVVTVLLALAVIFETVKYVFPQNSALKVVLKLARALGAIAALVATLMMLMAEVTPEGDRIFNLIILAERSVKLRQQLAAILSWHSCGSRCSRSPNTCGFRTSNVCKLCGRHDVRVIQFSCLQFGSHDMGLFLLTFVA